MKRKHCFILCFITLIAACTKDNETAPTGNFIGSWKCNEGTGTMFTIEITKLNDTEINIKNFSNYGDHANAKCEISSSSLSIATQDFNDLPNVQNIVSSGSGIYSKTGSTEKLTMSYTVDSIVFNNVVCTR